MSTEAEVRARLEEHGIRPSAEELAALGPLRESARQLVAALGDGDGLGALAAAAGPPVGEVVPGGTPTSARRRAEGPDGPLASVHETAARLASGEVTSVELVEALLARADELDPGIGAYLVRFDDEARAAARASDERRAAGTPAGPLDGLPFAAKDLIATREAPVTAQSRVTPAPFDGDAPCVARLRDGGLVLLGKTTLNEHAIGPIDPDGPFAVPRNPWDTGRWPGGSSSGSAAGVAAGLFPAALGSDTGGSVRIPAAMCGVAGFKPTFGLVDTAGVAPMSWSADTVGPLAPTALDCAVLLDALAGPGAPTPPAWWEGDLRGVRIGVDTGWRATPGLDPDVPVAFDAAVAALAGAGATVVEVELADRVQAGVATFVCTASEAFELHRNDLRDRWQEYGPATRLFLLQGAFLGAADYVRAQRLRAATARRLEVTFAELDVVVSPTVGTAAPAIDADHAAIMQLFFVSLWNAVGYPALSVPMGGGGQGLPLGLQLAGRRGADRTVLAVGAGFEAATRP
jgi:aspartyl-tRNA(Asn)/glutamyl-tRNA(Gln) amidotransferase subunit A